MSTGKAYCDQRDAGTDCFAGEMDFIPRPQVTKHFPDKRASGFDRSLVSSGVINTVRPGSKSTAKQDRVIACIDLI
jgi:hypothetical protein